MIDQSDEGAPLLVLDDGTEVTVRKGVFFKKGTVAVQIYDRSGAGASAYLEIDEARALRDALTARLDELSAMDSDG